MKANQEAGSKLANVGHDTRAIRHYLGHKNIQHTVRYTERHTGSVQELLAGLRRRGSSLFFDAVLSQDHKDTSVSHPGRPMVEHIRPELRIGRTRVIRMYRGTVVGLGIAKIHSIHRQVHIAVAGLGNMLGQFEDMPLFLGDWNVAADDGHETAFAGLVRHV